MSSNTKILYFCPNVDIKENIPKVWSPKNLKVNLHCKAYVPLFLKCLNPAGCGAQNKSYPNRLTPGSRLSITGYRPFMAFKRACRAFMEEWPEALLAKPAFFGQASNYGKVVKAHSQQPALLAKN